MRRIHATAKPRALTESADEVDVRQSVSIALEKKALEPVVLDVRSLTSYTDFIAIVSATNERQVLAIANAVVEGMQLKGRRPLGVEEGGPQHHWALIDFGDFVMHVFYHDTREFYDLESMLVEAPRLSIDVPPEQQYATESSLSR